MTKHEHKMDTFNIFVNVKCIILYSNLSFYISNYDLYIHYLVTLQLF